LSFDPTLVLGPQGRIGEGGVVEETHHARQTTGTGEREREREREREK
jgi:hypothetical protein